MDVNTSIEYKKVCNSTTQSRPMVHKICCENCRGREHQNQLGLRINTRVEG